MNGLCPFLVHGCITSEGCIGVFVINFYTVWFSSYSSGSLVGIRILCIVSTLYIFFDRGFIDSEGEIVYLLSLKLKYFSFMLCDL